MQLLANLMLLVALLGTLGVGAYACLALFTGRRNALVLLDRANTGLGSLIVLSCAVLTIALVSRDYSYMYVYEHVDNTLPLFYALTSFWAGAEGSLLFWILSISIMGIIFSRMEFFETFSEKTRLYYWLFFMIILSFFLLLITCWSSPFKELVPTPGEGRGLNPLLRNPGMIFHPPLLFLGYAGFTSPAALALAAYLSGESRSWVKFCRNWNLLSWAFLTAGIILGGWWSYMELGWGGYWAWDPVENASLIPWLSATAFMHTTIVELRRNALKRANVFLISFTFLLCIFGTYLVRGGVVQSLHAYGESPVALPFMIFMLSSIVLIGLVLFVGERTDFKVLSNLNSRQGLLVITAWVLLSLGLVIGLGTMWPVISKIWSQNPIGLDSKFYNRVCLPLFALIILIFSVCPWFSWKEGIRDKRGLMLVGGAFLGGLAVSKLCGLHNSVALITSAAAIAAVAGIAGIIALMPEVRKVRSSLGVYGVHFGVALVFLGVAWSGPNQVVKEFVLNQGESSAVGEYTATFKNLVEGQSPEITKITAIIEIAKGGKTVGLLSPERRIYRNFPQPFAEVSVIPGLGDEIYGTLLGVDQKGAVTLKVSINPLINWIWIGGTLMCLFALMAVRKTRLI